MIRYLLTLLLLLSFANAKYYNTNPLIERGIDPQILNLAVTIYKQDVAYQLNVTHRQTTGVEQKVEKFKLLYDPFKKYGIDIRIEVAKDDVKRYNKSDIKKVLDEMMGMQSYLQSEKLYKQESIEYLGQENGIDVIRFSFDLENIPRELKYFHALQGKVYIKNRVLQKIEVTNFKSFKFQGIDVEHYKQRLLFSQLIGASGYLLKSTSLSISGKRDALPYSSFFEGDFSSYWSEKKSAITLKDKNYKVEDKRIAYETINVNLDRMFPIYGQEVRKMGYDLPKPFGVSFINMYQQTRFYMTGISLDKVNGNDSIGDISKFFQEDTKYENSTYAALVKADMWVLPFLNFSLLVGGTSTATDINLDICLVPSLGCTTGDIMIPINTNSLLYGAGATIGGGIGNFFASVDFQYMISYTKSAEVETQINIITPIFGYYFQNLGLRLFGGGMYEDLKEEVGFKGRLDSGTEIEGTINLKAEKWAGTIGTQYAFTRHWEGNLLGAYGKDFQNLSLVITYRW